MALDCFREVRTESKTLKSSLLCLHCVDMDNEVHINIHELPCLQFLGFIGHVSFLDRLTERRMVIVPNRRSITRMLEETRSPTVIDVSCSFDMELEDHEPILIIREFVIAPGLNHDALKPQHDYSGTNDTPTMPWLQLTHCFCNCSKWPTSGIVLVSDEHNLRNVSATQGGAATPNIPEQEDNDAGGLADAANNDSSLMCAEVFKLKGCSFHLPMQKALRLAQRKIALKEEVMVKIFDQPVNVMDENALIAKVLFSDIYEPIGYVPGRKVHKFREAMNNNEIISVSLKQVHREYILAVNNFMLFGYVHVIKRGKWLPDNKSYKYNSYMSSLRTEKNSNTNIVIDLYYYILRL